MAVPKKLVLFVFFFCMFFLSMHLTTGCNNTGKGCLFADAAPHDKIKSRKVLYVLGGKKVVVNMHGLRDNGLVSKNLDKWEELRRVPAGPDPLHHNGSGPKKPRNSP